MTSCVYDTRVYFLCSCLQMNKSVRDIVQAGCRDFSKANVDRTAGSAMFEIVSVVTQ